MYQVTSGPTSEAITCLEEEWAHFEAAEQTTTGATFLLWEAEHPSVVLGYSGTARTDVFLPACVSDGVPILRRRTGGGAVVLGPGCLNYALIVSLVSHPLLQDVSASFLWVLERIVRVLGVSGLSIEGSTDLVLHGRKVSGNAQRRGRRSLIHHGTLLYDFDAGLASRYLKEPARRPVHRGNRTHAEFLGNLPLTSREIRERFARLASF